MNQPKASPAKLDISDIKLEPKTPEDPSPTDQDLSQVHPSRHAVLANLPHEARPRQGMALSENTEILKVINMNKMQHQYIQNLQKANMTLKCKIKEVSDLATEQDCREYQEDLTLTREDEAADPQLAEESGEPEEEFEMQAIGTIEQESQARQARKRREASKKRDSKKFYDRNSIGRSKSRANRSNGKQAKDAEPVGFYDKETSHK